MSLIKIGPSDIFYLDKAKSCYWLIDMVMSQWRVKHLSLTYCIFNSIHADYVKNVWHININLPFANELKDTFWFKSTQFAMIWKIWHKFGKFSHFSYTVSNYSPKHSPKHDPCSVSLFKRNKRDRESFIF